MAAMRSFLLLTGHYDEPEALEHKVVFEIADKLIRVDGKPYLMISEAQALQFAKEVIKAGERKLAKSDKERARLQTKTT